MIGIIICTTECNLRCKYCFEEHNMKSEDLVSSRIINEKFYEGMNVFKKFGAELIEYNKEMGIITEFTFHGGEPLLIKPQYINELCGYFCSLGKVKFNVQTNGTIMSDELLEVLKKYNFRVGVSIDGSEETNDENRVTANGKGTHSVILKNIKILQNAGLEVGAMATITKSITRDVRTFYEFYRKHNLAVGFNACYSSPNSDVKNEIDDREYCKFLSDLFDIWIKDDSSLMIQPFERIIKNMVRPKAGMGVCQFMEDCRGVNVAIDAVGNIYHCLHYCNLTNSALGNIKKEKLNVIIARHLEKKGHWERIKEEAKGSCKTCDIYNYCYGGCPYWSDAKELTGMDKDFNCFSQKYIVHYIYEQMKKRCE